MKPTDVLCLWQVLDGPRVFGVKNMTHSALLLLM